MTPAEKMASKLETGDCLLRDVSVDAPALIRRLADALEYAYDQLDQNGQAMLKYRHADALRDVKGQA